MILNKEMVSLTQKAITLLYRLNVLTTSKHLANIFDNYELVEALVDFIVETTEFDHKNYREALWLLPTISKLYSQLSICFLVGLRQWGSQWE